MKNFQRTVLAGFLTLVAFGCGAAHVRVDNRMSPSDGYDTVYVEPVQVQSVEQTAKAQALNDKIAFTARNRIASEIARSGRYRIAESPNDGGRMLIARTSMHVEYGNRAARYFVGYGAGRGGVDSTLDVFDPVTNESKLHATAQSDLAIGLFGGSMDQVINSNVAALVRKSGIGR